MPKKQITRTSQRLSFIVVVLGLLREQLNYKSFSQIKTDYNISDIDHDAIPQSNGMSKYNMLDAIRQMIAQSASYKFTYYKHFSLIDLLIKSRIDFAKLQLEIMLKQKPMPIKKGMAQGVSLEQAYEKYSGLYYAQIDAVTYQIISL